MFCIDFSLQDTVIGHSPSQGPQMKSVHASPVLVESVSPLNTVLKPKSATPVPNAACSDHSFKSIQNMEVVLILQFYT